MEERYLLSPVLYHIWEIAALPANSTCLYYSDARKKRFSAERLGILCSTICLVSTRDFEARQRIEQASRTANQHGSYPVNDSGSLLNNPSIAFRNGKSLAFSSLSSSSAGARTAIFFKHFRRPGTRYSLSSP